MALHVMVGRGPVGSTTGEELVARGHTVRVLSRSGGTSTDAVEHRAVDAAGAEALARAATGAAVLYHAVNPAYHRWPTDWPPVAAALLTAAERSGAVLVTMGNLYGYGGRRHRWTPESPPAATDVGLDGPRAPRARLRPRTPPVTTVVGMVSAWVLVTLAALAALSCGYGAVRLSRRPKAGRR